MLSSWSFGHALHRSRKVASITRAPLYNKMQSVFRAGLFEGKVAVVTGGGTGIGKAIARELLYLGSKVVISSRKEDKLQKAADELSRDIQPSSSSEVKVVPCNIREEQQVKPLLIFNYACMFLKIIVLVSFSCYLGLSACNMILRGRSQWLAEEIPRKHFCTPNH